MANSFVNAAIITVIYFSIRFLEMRLVLKENKPLKILVRDSLLVYLAVIGGDFIIEQIMPLTQGLKQSPQVFTSDPDF